MCFGVILSWDDVAGYCGGVAMTGGKDVKQVLAQESTHPLYRQLMARLREDIENGVYPVHGRIPSEQELCEGYGVSRVTVRKALAELTREGLLERHQGKGTFVCLPRIRKDLRVVNSFTEACRMMGVTPSTRVIHAQWQQADEDDCGQLLCTPQDRVVEVLRLRSADGMPVMLERNRFPAEYGWLLEEKLDGSLYALLRSRMIDCGQASHEVSLGYATASDARLLGIEQGAALLDLNETIYDMNGRPLHTSRQRIRGDRFTFRI